MSAGSGAREGGVVTLVHANPQRQTLTAAGVRKLHERLDALEQEQFERTLRPQGAAGAMRAFLRGERLTRKRE
jgi:hypothetical protein